MTQFPILFAWRVLVEGNGFVAGVDFRGRVFAPWAGTQRTLTDSSLGISVELITEPRAKNFRPSKISMAG